MNLLPAVAEPHAGHGGLLLSLLEARTVRENYLASASRRAVAAMASPSRLGNNYHNNTYAAACSQQISSISSAKRTAVASFAKVVNNAATSTRQSGLVEASE